MNIIIIGGGRKFGRHASEEFIKKGHNVFVMSHTQYENMLPNHVAADFSNTEDVLAKFNLLCASIDTIDVFLYLTRWVEPYSYQDQADMFTSSNNIVDTEAEWVHATRFSTAIPHRLILQALPKMDSTSRIIFLTSGLSLTWNNDPAHVRYAMYAAAKAAQNFLMKALAHHNGKNAIVCSISTHFPLQEDDPEGYVIRANDIVDLISTTNLSHNGQVVEFY